MAPKARPPFSADQGCAWAHAPPAGSADNAEPHLLDAHLRAVAALARQFATPALAPLAELAGLWHDLGKLRSGFQRYIRSTRDDAAHIERVADQAKTHSAAGALWAAAQLQRQHGPAGLLLARVLQYVIAGHHAGLDNWEGGLAHRLNKPETEREFQEATAHQMADSLQGPPLTAVTAATLKALAITNEHDSGQPGRFALWVRMLFSALVDADFLDTEAYMDGARSAARAAAPGIADLQPLLQRHLDAMTRDDSAVNRARAQVLAQCRAKALQPPGVFRLTVPTGGGKTLAGLNFALNHALAHDKRRVIVAIPYTSIIEQTADVYRSVFAALGDDAVVEHHSNAESDPEQETARSRLASENWDAPLIVTTNVQLFESLFACRTSRCRKLHNLADSVIVLDEAQLLPLEHLQPIVDVLRWLVQDFGVTLLLCTATQPLLDAPHEDKPSFDAQRGLRRGLPPATDIIDDVNALYRSLERVRVHLPADLQTPRNWPELADDVASHDAVLAIVSRRADAAELFRLVKAQGGDAPCWHLSALMCAQHRSDTIAAIKAALQARRAALVAGLPAQPVRVVSTQLVEAGVDLDFPVVFRALAGLDSIAQAAGRCNREGRLAEPGQVHVFVPPTQAPPGLLRLARQTCSKVWHGMPAEPLALDLVQQYFKHLLYDVPSTDCKQIAKLLRLKPDRDSMALPVQFREAAEAFKLIDDKDAATVLVRYRSQATDVDVNALIGLLEAKGPSRWLMRKLQRYGVSIYQHQLTSLLQRGDITEIATCPGLYVQREGWDGFYDPVLGARVDSAPGDPASFVT
ncbi:MAG TPA: CRISPR-associated endonuclease Cas3'' [Aquabacterium sp.]|nr:CRISPR-associated endonuclease Cas3'' [Aquabacterium sp.]